MGEDLLPESRTWSKEEIMGAKSSRDWLSNWSLGLIGNKGNAVQTQYKPDLLVEKGKKVGTGGQVNRVSPALDLLASHSIRCLYRTKMGPT